MNWKEQAKTSTWKLAEWLKGRVWRLRELYHPDSLRQKGLFGSLLLLLVTALVIAVFVGWYWSREPEQFDVRQVALKQVGGDEARLVVGVTYTATLVRIGETLLGKPGGYLSNDVMPPGVWLDNMPNWEFGALVMLRDAAAALRNHFARSQSQSVEDPDLAQAEPIFNFSNDSWMFPATEREYRKGLRALGDYERRLGDQQARQAQFFARADNLRQYLEIVEKRLGSLSQRLSASVGQLRINTDLATTATRASGRRSAISRPASSTMSRPMMMS